MSSWLYDILDQLVMMKVSARFFFLELTFSLFFIIYQINERSQLVWWLLLLLRIWICLECKVGKWQLPHNILHIKDIWKMLGSKQNKHLLNLEPHTTFTISFCTRISKSSMLVCDSKFNNWNLQKKKSCMVNRREKNHTGLKHMRVSN